MRYLLAQSPISARRLPRIGFPLRDQTSCAMLPFWERVVNETISVWRTKSLSRNFRSSRSKVSFAAANDSVAYCAIITEKPLEIVRASSWTLRRDTGNKERSGLTCVCLPHHHCFPFDMPVDEAQARDKDASIMLKPKKHVIILGAGASVRKNCSKKLI